MDEGNEQNTLVKGPDHLGEVGDHVSRADDVAHVLGSSEDDHFSITIDQTIVRPYSEEDGTALPSTRDFLDSSSLERFQQLCVTSR